MIIKLPIIINEKILKINFILKKVEDFFIVKPFNDDSNKIYNILLTSNYSCINKIPIKFPLKFTLINSKYLFSKIFFYSTIISDLDFELNFLNCLLVYIRKFDENLEYVTLEYLLENYEIIIKKCSLELIEKKTFENLYDLSIYFDNILCFTLNLIFLLLYKFPNYSDKDFKKLLKSFTTKKIINCLILVKKYLFSFNGSFYLNFSDHNNNLENKSIDNLNINIFYYIEIEKKIFKVKIKNIDNNLITLNDSRIIDKDKCKFFIYNPKFNNIKKLEYLIKTLINNEYDLRLLLSSKVFNKDSTSIKNILDFIYIDDKNLINLSSLRNLKYIFNNLEYKDYNDFNTNLEFKILEDGYISLEYIIYLDNKYKDNKKMKHKILKILFDNYNFPLFYNKKYLNENFELIIYYSLLNYNDLIKVIDTNKIYLENEILEIIPGKLKNLYFNLIKTYYQFKKGSFENIIYNFKFYQDYIYIYVIKNILQNNSIISKLFNDNNLYKLLLKSYSKNIILDQLISQLNWNNISSNLNFLSYIYKCPNLIFYQGKLNRNFFNENVNFKIKDIIINKFIMYKYLKYEKDFIKWTKFLKDFIFELYETPISINNNDLIILGKLIFKLYNLEIQNLKDTNYLNLINFCQKNKKLIILNSRINLLIKEKLSSLKCHLNLGYFAKHLNFNNIDKIEITPDKELEKIKLELKIVTKKYYKYKGKYLYIKDITTTNNQV